MSVKAHIIAGPIKGGTYQLKDGENVIGRATSNEIVLPNSQVSKRHVILVVHDKKVELVDAGSANGTFVNGVLVKKKHLNNGDKISVGPFVIEILIPGVSRGSLVVKNQNNLSAHHDHALSIPGGEHSIAQSSGSAMPATGDLNSFGEGEPKSLVTKMVRKFDDIVLPVVFEFSKTYDWLTVVSAMFVAFLVINLGMTVYPLMDAAKESVLRETESKAKYIAKQITHINASAMAEGAEGKLDVSFAEIDVNVQAALIVNIESRILAPGSRLNEIYADTIFLKYRDNLRRGDQKYWRTLVHRTSDGIVTVLEPIMILSKSKGINVPGAVAVVKYSTAGSALDSGTVSVVYFEALVMSALIGAIFIYLLFHFSNNPLRVLNDDLDAILKGNLDEVSKKFKMDSLSSLIDSINALVSRIPKTVGDSSAQLANATDDQQARMESVLRATEALGAIAKGGVMLLDNEQRVKYINPYFEELTGIHAANAIGESVINVCRDEALASLMKDLIERSPSAGAHGIREDFEFGKGAYGVNCVAVLDSLNRVDAFVISAEKTET